jgi:Uma2 family endonuclease
MTTVAELALDPERDFEIVNGKPEVKEMAGAKHGSTIMRLGARLVNHVEPNDLGIIYSPDTTFTIGEDERLPDLGFVSATRIPPEGEPEGIWEIAPDLAIEVISPNDVLEKVNAKMADYFAAGVREVWLISLRLKTVSIYNSLTQVRILGEHDDLISETLLPGFRCRVGDIFGKARRS